MRGMLLTTSENFWGPVPSRGYRILTALGKNVVVVKHATLIPLATCRQPAII